MELTSVANRHIQMSQPLINKCRRTIFRFLLSTKSRGLCQERGGTSLLVAPRQRTTYLVKCSVHRREDRRTEHISLSVAEFDALRMTISAQIASKLHQTHFASPGTKAEAEGGSSLGGPAERELLDGRINVLLVYRVDY